MAHAAIAFAKAHARRRDDGLHHVDRPGRDQHGHRRRRRPRQPPAGAAPARRRVRRAAGPTRCCSSSRPSATRPSPSTTASARSRATSTASRAPSSSSRACPAALRVLHRPGRLRPGDPGAAAGRADRGLRLPGGVLPPRVAPHPAAGARRRASSRGRRERLREARAPAHRRRRRRQLRAGRSALAAFAERHGLPVAETQAGKGALPWDHPRNVGAIGVTGSSAANTLAARADVVLAVGTRLGDFATGSRALFRAARSSSRSTSARSTPPSTARCRWSPTPTRGLEALGERSAAGARRRPGRDRRGGSRRAGTGRSNAADGGRATAASRPTPRSSARSTRGRRADVVVCAAGGLPGELHKLWRADGPGGYHLEYGYSCMGYEIAGGLGVKLARPDREVCVLVGDGSYLMLNSEIATVGGAGREAHDRRARQPRLRLHPPPAAGVRRRAVQQPARREPRRRRRLRRPRAEPRRAGGDGRSDRRPRGRAGAGPAGRPDPVVVIETDPRRGTRQAARGGTWRSPRSPTAPEVTRGARALRTRRGAASARRLTMIVRIGINPLGWTNDDLPELGDDIPLETCLRRGERGRLRGRRARPQVPARAGRAGPDPRAARPRAGLGLVRRRAPGALGRGRDRRAAARTSTSSRAWAATVMVFAEVCARVHGGRDARSPAGRGSPRREWPRLRRAR